MRGHLRAAALAAVAVLATAVAPSPSAPARVFDDERAGQRRCNALDWVAPAALAADHLVGEQLRLRVHVLADSGVPGAGLKLLRQAGPLTYDGIRVDLRFSFSQVQVPGTGDLETSRAFEIAKSATGGAPPAGADVVYLVTDNELTSGGNPVVAGQADCIGGIMHPSEAFAVGEFDANDLERGEDGLWGTGVGVFHNLTGKVFAHEIGHLLGAHHHYANCAEGIPSNPTGDALSACTLMINDVGLASFNFSSFNAAVTRGHVRTFGRNNG